MKAVDVAFQVANQHGWLVFPLKPLSKKPFKETNGFLDASNDPAQIARWNAQYPNANWGVATGLESGVGVVDIDGEEGEVWYDSQWFDDGAVVRTPRGGKHVFFSLVDETEYKSSKGEIHHQIDTRFEGGYALLPGSATSSKVDPKYGDGPYVGDLSQVPDLPAAVGEILPLRFYRPDGDEKVYYDMTMKPAEASLGEQRVIENVTKMLDQLPRPWQPGAGYHQVMFNAACWFWAIIQSPEYALTESQAAELYFQHSPKTNPPELAHTRWEEGRKKTDGHPAEPPGDVPPLIAPQDILDPEEHPEIDRLFWELEHRRDLDQLLRACRRAGLSEQQGYSLASAAKANSPKVPQWGRTKRIYGEVPSDEAVAELDVAEVTSLSERITERQKAEEKSLRGHFLSDEERSLVDRTPNFIDLYVEVNKAIYPEPNLPIVYLNAWMGLASLGCEHGYLALKQGRRPLNLYGLNMAASGSGKGDARAPFTGILKAYPEGLSSLAGFGRKPTAEAMEKALIDRNGRSALLMVDEAAQLIQAFHAPKTSYMGGLLDLILETYDGEVTQSARVGHTEDERGRTVSANFNVWLQGTWEGITGELTEGDIQSGLVGRFIPAIGWPGNFTEQSLELEYADEYQIAMGGDNPLVTALGEELAEVFRSMPPGGHAIVPASKEVNDRMTRFRVDVKNHIDRHPMSKEMMPIMARLTLNAMKAAALIALSNGRSKVEMTDLYVALKSAEYWIGTMMQLCSAVVSGDLRKKVNALIEFISVGPRSDAQILRSAAFKNLTKGEINMLLDRAEAEGQIIKEKEKWQIRTSTQKKPSKKREAAKVS